MNTPPVTPTQYGAGGLFAAVVAGCLAKDITGTDLIVYVAGAAFVCGLLVYADGKIRTGRNLRATAETVQRAAHTARVLANTVDTEPAA